MKILHILKTEPDATTKRLIETISRENESTIFALYEQEADYDRLIDLIFAHESNISWW